MHLYIPRRGLLKARWQVQSDWKENIIAELDDGVYAAAFESDIYKDEGDPEWLGQKPSFEHRLHRRQEAYTYSGWLACYVLHTGSVPRDPVNILMHVWEVDEDIRVVRVAPDRVRVATATIDYISPTGQERELIEVLARRTGDSPRSDTLM